MSLPVLEAAPGMPAHLVRKGSSAPLGKPDPRRRSAYLQPRDPHAFVLRCTDAIAVDVGESLFTVITLRHDTAYRILSTTQLDYLDRAETLARAEALIARLQAAGFTATEHLDRAAAEALSDRDEHMRLAELTAPHGSGSWRAEMWLRRTAPLPGRQEDCCLATLIIQDDALRAGGP